jgi:hypothetical protein
MGIFGQIVASRAGSSPAVAALSAIRSRRFVSMPDFHKAGFMDSTAPVTITYGFHCPERPKSPVKSAPTSGATAGSAESIPSAKLIQRFDAPRPEHLSAAGPDLTALLEDGAALLDSARLSATAEARLLGFVEAADFAGRVEEISRSVEYLQLVAAQAVERARKEAQQAGPGSSAAAQEWRTGWTEPMPGTDTASVSNVDGRSTDAAQLSDGTVVPVDGDRSTDAAQLLGGTGTGSAEGGAGSTVSVLDDGYRDAAQFLRARLRIGIGEARRRLALAPEVLPQAGMTGQEIPARRETLAEAVGSGMVSSRSATIISTALDKVRHLTDEDTITRMEHSLTTTAVETDPDFVTTMTKRWIDSIDQNGPEPSEEVLRQHQGAFLRKRRRYGLHHIEIFATDEQYETLTTAMNVATNPRLTTAGTETGPDLDLRTRAQKLLNGLVGACSVAMTTAKLPSNGGYRPQLAITIGYQELLGQVSSHNQASQHKQRGTDTTTGTDAGAGAGLGTGTGSGTGTATFLGPIHPTTIRKIACDADIIPVLLGSDSRVLDIGRTTRIFPSPHPKSHHRPRPRLRLPRLHHARTLVRSPPHHLLVPRRHHRHRQRHLALQPPPPPHPQGTLAHRHENRRPLVHPPTPHRPPPNTPTQPPPHTPQNIKQPKSPGLVPGPSE